MANGFRKALFGFQCKDVMDYIENTNKTFEKKVAQLQKKITELKKDNQDLNDRIVQLNNEKNEIQQKLEQYDRQYADIKRLSENIGKLYLVSQTNAQQVISRCAENSLIANEQTENNLSVLEETQSSLSELKTKLTETSEAFNKKINELLLSLYDAKEKISQNRQAEEDAKDEFARIYEMLEK